jgi:phospholipase C
LNSLIAAYGLATNYDDSGVHPSLPNYLTMISGAPQYPGKVDLVPTAKPFPVAAPNLGTQLQAAGIPWRSYQESMGTSCKLSNSGNYAPKHDPFLYFTDIQTGANGLCAKTNVDYSQFAADLASGAYRYMWITPNLLDDGHNPQQDPVTGLKTSDAWAATEIPKIMASAAYKNGGIIFITWDEAEGRHGDSKEQIPMIVVSTKITKAGYKATTAYSHKSYLATIEDLFGLPRLATVASEPAMMEFFK